MTEDEARRRMATARVGRLASIDRNGRPHLVPICFAVSGDRVVSVVDQKPKRTMQLRRLENIRRSPDIQLVVDHYDDDWSTLWWVRISGHGRVIDAGLAREDAIDLLASKYPQYREHRPAWPVLAIEITQISGWQATTD
jgi:PPOX class probable F420-dependent enzyme